MGKSKMTNRQLAISGITTFLVLAAIPHLFVYLTGGSYGTNVAGLFTKVFDQETVDYWFEFINNGSVTYIIVPFFIIELIRYKYLNRMDWNLIGDSIANIISFVAFLMIEIVLGFLFLYTLYFWVYENMSIAHLPNNWVTIIMCVIMADFAYYWDHRMMHRIGIGWATHTVHHSSEHFNMSVAYRFGPLDAVFPILFSIPLVMVGFHPMLILGAEIFVQSYQAILHTEMIGKLPRPIEYVLNTPSHHRVHHGVNRVYWDKNYAGIFMIWDRMFDTFEEENEIVRYGVTEPINSVNPLVVFFHGLTRLFKQVREAKGIKNKLLYLIKPPGWSPKS